MTVAAVSMEDTRLVDDLRRGDEAAFSALVAAHHSSLVRVASLYVRDAATAEEVAQDTWLAVLRGIDGFEGRASLKTWIFRILTNKAKTRAMRERRTVPFSALAEADDDAPTVEPGRFFGVDQPHAGHWSTTLEPWQDLPEQRLLSREIRAEIEAAIATLTGAQREVITLRDIEGWSADEVCRLLNLSEINQRVLLHRARAKVRQALESYLSADPAKARSAAATKAAAAADR